MSTGDKNLDSPATRQRMEDSYESSANESGSLRNEKGGACNQAGKCLEFEGSPDQVAILYPRGAPMAFDWHTHPNEGRRTANGAGVYEPGPSRQDRKGVREDSKKGMTHPSYVIGPDKIWVLTPNGKGGYTTTSHNRWKP